MLEESRLKGSKGRNREMGPGALSARVHNGLESAVLGVSRVTPIECADGLDVRHEMTGVSGLWLRWGRPQGEQVWGTPRDSVWDMLRLRHLLGVYTDIE